MDVIVIPSDAIGHRVRPARVVGLDSVSGMRPGAFPNAVQADSRVTLRLARDSDAEAIAEWTRDPGVHQFWGGRAMSVDEVLAKYTGRRAPAVASYVICEQGRPVGYLQAWQRTGGGCGLDMFVACDAQGRGIGPRAARALATELAAEGRTPLTVDPAVDNARAIKAWRAAGFRETGELGDDDGVPTQMMSFLPSPNTAVRHCRSGRP